LVPTNGKEENCSSFKRGNEGNYAFFDSGHQAYTIIAIMASNAIGNNKKLFMVFISV
jgi:hypothetical protein